MSERELGVALLGLGHVGAGVVKLLEDNAAAIGARLGGRLVVRAIAVREPVGKKRLVDVDPALLTADVHAAIDRPDVDIVCELMGGDGLAKDAVMAAIAAGKHVVTANKLLLARHGTEVFAAAERHGVDVYYEAAVCGGVPIIRVLREGLASDRVTQLHGIVNGTSNFILTDDGPRWPGLRRRPGRGPSAWATPRPTPASTSAVATPPTSWRSCAACVSGHRRR
jgi:homoserine dehydrogenase